MVTNLLVGAALVYLAVSLFFFLWFLDMDRRYPVVGDTKWDILRDAFTWPILLGFAFLMIKDYLSERFKSGNRIVND